MAEIGSVRVIVRFRPVNDIERSADGGQESLLKVSGNNLKISKHADDLVKNFTFDHIFFGSSTQNQIYEQSAKATIEDVKKGFNGTIFAYGQTGAGKSFTMTGPNLDSPEQLGIIPRAMSDLFEMIEATSARGLVWQVNVGVMELYNEKVNDLIDRSKKDLPMQESVVMGKRVTSVRGLSDNPVKSMDDVWRLLKISDKNRQVASTSMNAGSSRSHSVFRVTLRKMRADDPTQAEAVSVLHMVDLAGSEKLGKTHVRGQQAAEATYINQSLTTLGRCIKAIGEVQKIEAMAKKGKKGGKQNVRIPFRESVLTRMLKDSLVGNCKTTLVVCCSPAHYNLEETLSTLAFARRARAIRSNASVNIVRTKEELERLVQSLTARCKELEAENAALKAGGATASPGTTDAATALRGGSEEDEEDEEEAEAPAPKGAKEDDLKKDIAELTATLADTQAELEEAEQISKQRQEELDAARGRIAELEASDPTEKGDGDVPEVDCKEVEAELERLQEKHKEELESMGEEMEDLRLELEKNEQQLQEVFAESEVLAIDLRRAEADRDALAKEYEAFEAEKEATLEQLDLLVQADAELAEVKEVRDAAVGMVADLKEELEDLKEKAETAREVEDALADALTDLEVAKEEHEATKQKLTHIESDLAAAQKKVEAEAAKVAKCEAAQTAVENDLATVKEENASLKSKADLLQREMDAVKEGGNALESVKDQEIEGLQDTVEELRSSVSTLERRVAAQQKVMDGLEEEAEELEEETNEMKAERDAARAESEKSATAVAEERAKAAKAEKEARKIRSKLEEDLAEAVGRELVEQEEHEKTRKRIKSAEKKAKSAEKKLEEANAKRQQAEAAASNADKQIGEYGEQIAELKGIIEALQQQIKDNEAMVEGGRALVAHLQKELGDAEGGVSLIGSSQRRIAELEEEVRTLQDAAANAPPPVAADTEVPAQMVAPVRARAASVDGVTEAAVKAWISGDATWEVEQRRLLTVWVSVVLAAKGAALDCSLDDGIHLEGSFKNGAKLVLLAEQLTRDKAKRYHENPAMGSHKVDNINCALDLLRKHGARCSIEPASFLDAARSEVVHFLWTLFQTFVGNKAGCLDANAEVDELLEWTRAQLKADGITPNNFVVDWLDGKAFCALVATLGKDAGDWAETEIQTLTYEAQYAAPAARLSAAFAAAEAIFQVPAILEAEAFLRKDMPPDPRSTKMYLSMLKIAKPTQKDVADAPEDRDLERTSAQQHPLMPGVGGDDDDEPSSPVVPPIMTLAAGWRSMPVFPGDARIYKNIDVSDAQPDDWYYQHFYGKDHVNIVGRNKAIGNLVVSVVEAEDQQGVTELGYRVLIRHNRGVEKGILPKSVFGRSSLKSWGASRIILPALMLDMQPTAYTTIRDPVAVQGDLLDLEARMKTTEFKFGVMYARKGQRKEADVMNNVGTNSAFDDFMKVMGDRVKMRGFHLFSGGLDTKDDADGAHSVYTTWRGFPVMFHVVPMMPLPSSGYTQRKALVDEDISNIVFVEEGGEYPINAYTSKAGHVTIVVSPVSTYDGVKFRVSVAHRVSVPAFEPPLFDCLYDLLDLREVILALAINGERATCRSPDFLAKQERARMEFLDYVVEKHHKGSKGIKMPSFSTVTSYFG